VVVAAHAVEVRTAQGVAVLEDGEVVLVVAAVLATGLADSVFVATVSAPADIVLVAEASVAPADIVPAVEATALAFVYVAIALELVVAAEPAVEAESVLSAVEPVAES
jgi:hypothetical protein